MSKKIAPSIRNPDSIYERENRTIAKSYNSQPLANGLLLSGISLSTSTTLVSHRLGRPFQGFIVVHQDAPQHIYRDASVTTQLSTFIPLKADGNVTADLWVF